MQTISKSIFLCFLMCLSFSVYSQNNPIQDTAAAVQYFENEMNFTIGPAGVKKAVLAKNENIAIIDLRKAETAYQAASKIYAKVLGDLGLLKYLN